jgi:PAS domain S-box-containing protein
VSAADPAPLRLLLLEDEPTDAELTVRQLRRDGLDFVSRRVDSRDAFVRALEEFDPSVVLADCRLPDFDGAEALLIAQAARPDLPVIMVTGALGDETAIGLLKAGARDYVLKNNLVRLASAIRRALDDAREVRERKRAEQEAQREREYVATVMEASPIGLLVADRAGRFVFANSAAAQLLGVSRDQILGRSHDAPEWELTDFQGDLVPPEELPFARIVRDRRPAGADLTLSRPDGQRVYLAIKGAPLLGAGGVVDGVVFATEDMTERRELEERFRQSQKLEAVARLAGGVAHDFNNMLAVINSYAELAIQALHERDPLRADVQEILKAGTRAAVLTKRLLAFSRKQMLRPVVLGLNEVVADLEQMLRRLIGEDVTFRFVLSPEAGNVRADPGQLEQVLMNLVVNARDAMPRGGELTVETAAREVDEATARADPEVQPGRYVVLAVTDTGCGMDQATLARIFEPFFTTKQPGQGTGLGLATVYGIVKQSAGFIAVQSEPGKGSTFRIHLPRVDAPAEGSADARRRPPIATGHETVLLVEDEDAVRALTQRILRDARYEVLTAASGAEALERSAQHAGPIHLVVSDVIMPSMSGPELAERLLQLRPETRVLFMSGYVDEHVTQHGILASGHSFLPKPFTASELARKVRETLDAPAPGAAPA